MEKDRSNQAHEEKKKKIMANQFLDLKTTGKLDARTLQEQKQPVGWHSGFLDGGKNREKKVPVKGATGNR